MCQLFRHVEIIPYHSVLCRWLSAIQNKIIKIVQWFFTIKKTLSSIVIILWSVCAECYVAIKNVFSRFLFSSGRPVLFIGYSLWLLWDSAIRQLLMGPYSGLLKWIYCSLFFTLLLKKNKRFETHVCRVFLLFIWDSNKETKFLLISKSILGGFLLLRSFFLYYHWFLAWKAIELFLLLVFLKRFKND